MQEEEEEEGYVKVKVKKKKAQIMASSWHSEKISGGGGFTSGRLFLNRSRSTLNGHQNVSHAGKTRTNRLLKQLFALCWSFHRCFSPSELFQRCLE